MKILVCGAADYTNQGKVIETLDNVKPSSVVHSDSTGVDGFAAAWCLEKAVKQYPNHAVIMSRHSDLKLVLAFGTDAAVEKLIVEAQSRTIKVIRIRA